MSKKIKILNLRASTIHFLFFLFACSLIASVIFYNSYLSEKKTILTYEINLKSENWNTKIFFKDNKVFKDSVFNKLYSKKNEKIKFQEIIYADETIKLISTKNFYTKNRNAVNNFEAEYDAFISSFVQSYIKELDLFINSFLEDEYFFTSNLEESFISNDLIYNMNEDEKNNFILSKKSKNFEEYLKLKKLNYKIDYKKMIKNEERKISYIDLFISLILISIIYLSFLMFFKIIKIN